MTGQLVQSAIIEFLKHPASHDLIKDDHVERDVSSQSNYTWADCTKNMGG
ncbi:MAG: hypothetical protein RIF37_17940 [Rhodospirillaceae bacterium]